MLLVDAGHQSSGWWQYLVDKDEDGLLWRELDTLADDVDELSDGEVGWNEILLLVDGGDLGLLDLLADNLDSSQYMMLRRRGGDMFTGMRSLYFARMRSASALRLANSCSSLNLERMAEVFFEALVGVGECMLCVSC